MEAISHGRTGADSRAAASAKDHGGTSGSGTSGSSPSETSHSGTSPSETSPSGASPGELLLAGVEEYRLGRLKEALEPLAEAHKGFVATDQPGDAVEALLALARVERELGLLDQAAERSDEALALARSLGESVAEADALNLKAAVLGARGDYIGALEHLENGLALAQRAGAEERQANILSNIGGLHTQLGDHPRALECLQSAYQLIRKAAPGTKSEAVNLIGLGRLYYELGDNEAVRRYFTQAREVGRQANDALIELASLNLMANLSCRLERWTEALELFGEALDMVRRLGIRHYEVDNLDGIGQVHTALGQHEQATASYGRALELAQEIEDREGEIDALVNLGRVSLAVDRTEEAIELLHRSLELAGRIDRKRSMFEAHELLAVGYERRGELSLALHHQREYHRVEKAVFNQENEQRSGRLAMQFELERARHEVEAYQLEVVQQAREEAEGRVRAQTLELEEAQREIVTRLAVAAEYRDDETGEHTWRVARYTAAIARTLGWPEDEVQLLSSAARLHDLGKIGIPDSVLMKPEKLSISEFETICSHTVIGARILEGAKSGVLRLAQEIALAHHERWDGKGYPLGLEGEEIPLSARIVATADVLDALTHERPYKRAWSPGEALAEIARNSGHQFDPTVVAACLEAFSGTEALFLVPEAYAGESSRLVDRRDARSGELSPAGLGRRFDEILADRTKELERARREAELSARRLHAMAYSDPLTGLANRRAFEQDLAVEVVRARRHDDSLAVLTLDLDALKTINDTEGHERGDVLLTRFAAAVEAELRERGRVYRIGGDEFAAILLHVEPADSAALLARVADAVERVRCDGFPRVNTSAGIALLPDDAASPAELMRLSDQRMYRDKLRHRTKALARTSRPAKVERQTS
ncbi:MAG: tetratricopeptide repeat protein [Trueperaceae bacterium]